MYRTINLNIVCVLAMAGLVVLFSESVDAQRPSLGDLQGQIDQLLNGEADFSEVSFGPECSIGICPGFSGLTEKDPFGLRLLGQDNSGCILRFGPTDECTIGIDPALPGMTFRDIGCFNFENPLGKQPWVKINGGQVGFGEQCTIGVLPGLPGLIFSDPGCFVFNNPIGLPPLVKIPGGVIRFGDQCSIGVDPNFTGIVERDPGGLRLLGQNGQGCRLTFGPTDLCRIMVDPDQPEDGIRIQDPRRVVFENPEAPGAAMVAVDGVLFAQEVVQLSRGDLKENVRQIDDALETVKKLRGVYFDWKEDAKESKPGQKNLADIGFIAEEVADVLSEAAFYDAEGDKPQGVKY